MVASRPARKVLTSMVGLFALLSPVVVSTQVDSAHLSFTEALVTVTDRSLRDSTVRQLTTTRFADRATLLDLIISAYLDADTAGPCALKLAFGVECPAITGVAPAWMRTTRFEISAALPTNLPADTVDRLRTFRSTGSPRRDVYPLPVQSMLQRLLEDTFSLRVRRQQREVAVWAITMRQPTSLLVPSRAAGAATRHGLVLATRPFIPPRAPDDPVQLVFESASLKDTADFFSAYVDRPVVDRTGVDGDYDFAVEFKGNSRAPWPKGGPIALMAGFDARQLATALEPLGFAIEPATARFDVLVIEQVAIPRR